MGKNMWLICYDATVADKVPFSIYLFTDYVVVVEEGEKRRKQKRRKN